MKSMGHIFCLKSDRILWLDAARGIGIILVILGHIIPMDQPICHVIYSFHIPLFFFLSGMILQLQKKKAVTEVIESGSLKAKRFIRRKCQSLLYPYVVFSFLGLVAIRYRDGLERFGDHLPGALFFLGNGPLWFLPALFVAELLFFLGNEFCHAHGIGAGRTRIRRILVLATAFFFSTWFAGHFYFAVGNPDALNGWTLLNVVNRGVIGFLWMEAGSALAVWNERRKLPGGMRFVTAAAAMTVCVFLSGRNSYVDLHYSLIGNPVLYYACGFLASASVVCLCQLLPTCVQNGLAFLGKNSLFIFATHMNLGLVPTVLQCIPLPDGWGKWIISAWSVLVCEIIAVLFVNRFMPELIRYRSFQKKTTKDASVFSLLCVGGGAFFLFQYAKYLLTSPDCLISSGFQRSLLVVLCFAAALGLLMVPGLLQKRQSGQRGKVQEDIPTVSMGKTLACIIMGNGIWYIMLYKTMEIFPIRTGYIAAGGIAIFVFSVFQCVRMYRNR